MKKTLITLMALSGIAMGDVEGDWEGNFTWGIDNEETKEINEGLLTFAWNEEVISPITITDLISSAPNYKAASGHAIENVYRPDINVGNVGPWTLTFTVTNTGSEALYLTHFTLDAFTFAGDGNWQYNAQDISLTLTQGESIVGSTRLTFPSGDANYGNKSTLTEVLVYTGLSNLKLEGGSSVTLGLTAQAYNSGGTFVGLQGMTVRTEYLPEPTTATLSLLALCGLAARRRRK